MATVGSRRTFVIGDNLQQNQTERRAGGVGGRQEKREDRETINNRRDKTQTADEKRQMLKHSLHKNVIL